MNERIRRARGVALTLSFPCYYYRVYLFIYVEYSLICLFIFCGTPAAFTLGELLNF